MSSLILEGIIYENQIMLLENIVKYKSSCNLNLDDLVNKYLIKNESDFEKKENYNTQEQQNIVVKKNKKKLIISEN
jgi:hypothetical protein